MKTPIEQLICPHLLDLQPYSSARHEFQGKALVPLDANEHPYDTGLNRYPDPLQLALKSTIASLRRVRQDNLFIGNGSDEAIDLLIRLFCRAGRDHILVLPPTYGMYEVAARISNVAVREIPLLEGFQPDVDAILERASEQSKLLFLCSPNNPSGNTFAPELVERLLREFRGIVVIDEAYIDFSSQAGYAPRLSEFPNLVVLQTLSKAWGLAGLRLGIALANPELIQWLNRIKPPYNVNLLSQQTAIEKLSQIDKIQNQCKKIMEERERLAKELARFSIVKKVFPSEANFLLVRFEEPETVYRFLMGRGIIVRNRSSLPLCEGCLRITIGTPAQNERLLTHLQPFFL